MHDIEGRWAKSKFVKSAIFLGILFYLWIALPAIHDVLRLCPVRPDGVRESRAIPSFARQTGMSCVMCHTNFPELTPFGRRFKLNGYTLTTKQADVSDYSVTLDTHTSSRNLLLSYVSPLSYVAQVSYARWQKAPPDPNAGTSGVPAGATTQQDTFLLPDQLSLFYAGRMTDNIGAWFMLTYDATAGSVGIDNTELRFADHTDDRKWVYGAFINNTPGMQDVYNTPLSAFGIPLFNVPSLYNQGNGTGVGGLKAPLLGTLATISAGAGAYAFYDDSLYAEFSGYHSGVPGNVALGNPGLVAPGASGAISGMAPYVRLAYEKDWGRHSAEIGVLGMQTDFLPGGIANASARSPVTANQFEDGGVDWMYQYITDKHMATLLGAYTHEKVNNNSLFVGSNFSNNTDFLDQLSMTAEYYYKRRYGGLVNFVNTTGTTDPLNGGSPNNQYWVFELDYMPWLNTKFILQYDLYTVVDGAQNPYGIGAKPSNNNTAVVGLWTAF
jgi:hypothetical protein